MGEEEKERERERVRFRSSRVDHVFPDLKFEGAPTADSEPGTFRNGHLISPFGGLYYQAQVGDIIRRLQGSDGENKIAQKLYDEKNYESYFLSHSVKGQGVDESIYMLGYHFFQCRNDEYILNTSFTTEMPEDDDFGAYDVTL